MIHESFDSQDLEGLATETVISVGPDGVLEATLLLPSKRGTESPLLVLHGIARNTTEIVNSFAGAAEASGRPVVVPHFAAATWPVFQRINRRARPDRGLLNLFNTLRSFSADFAAPYDIFGFSGGAQLAHRFAMLYPELVGALHLGAAGWYTMPDTDIAYPYGLGDGDRARPWTRRMQSGLAAFLARDITVYVGELDTQRDASLRVNNRLDQEQGPDRLARAAQYVSCINSRRQSMGLIGSATLQVLTGCGHSCIECIGRGDLANRVCAPR